MLRMLAMNQITVLSPLELHTFLGAPGQNPQFNQMLENTQGLYSITSLVCCQSSKPKCKTTTIAM